MDHYHCNNYYVPETRAYHILGSSELFPQHCRFPSLTPHQHLRALTDELTKETDGANQTPKGRCLLKLLGQRIDNLLTPPSIVAPQRVTTTVQSEDEQRVVDDYPIITVPRITDVPPIMQSHNPTAKRLLMQTPCMHC